jgi:phenylacetate-CoA ligase
MNGHFDALELRSPEKRDAAKLDALNAALAGASRNQPFWRDRLAPFAELADLAALARLPLLRKSDLQHLQAQQPPFGGLNATPVSGLSRLFVSPGPIFDPEGRGEDWWSAARAMYAAGVRPGDILLNTFSYHLTPAAFIFEAGARALGCPVIPAGPGNTMDQLVAIRHYRPKVYIGTPDFLRILLEKAEASGGDCSSIQLAVVTGAALSETSRQDLNQRGVKVFQCYGTADLGIVAYEDDGPGMVLSEEVIAEIIRPGTGDLVAAGEVGELVVTRLCADYPLFRFATGDLTAILPDHFATGRTSSRIRGWLGRADQATKVKGMFVRPEQIAAVAAAVPGTGRLRLVVTREDEQDRMELRAEHADGSAQLALLERLSEITRLKGTVVIVPPGSLPNDGTVIADERGRHAG